MDIKELVQVQRQYFLTGETRTFQFRFYMLSKLKQIITDHMEEIEQALYQDLHKSPHEAYMSEISLVLGELRYQMKHLRKWMRPEKVLPSLGQMPSRVRIHLDPKGVVLIMSPWNYPLLLTLSPLIGAISAGNCAVVKPSAYSSATSALMKQLMESEFPPEYISFVEGGREKNQALLKERFDHIFFTGSTTVGKVVMESAAAFLTPVTLELGGKSPAIVEESADLARAAKRIVFGKLLNAGQTCIAPDYVLVARNSYQNLMTLLKKELDSAVGNEYHSHPHLPRIINEKQHERLVGLLSGEQILHGGRFEYPMFEPTLISPDADARSLTEEIFGPILPVLPYDSLDQVVSDLQGKEKPLALYLFTESSKVKKRILSELAFGGGCINDTILHIASHRTPFGGVGMSGMGSYHGKRSFMVFSQEKTVVDKGSLFDLPVRYHPYSQWKEKLVRTLL